MKRFTVKIINIKKGFYIIDSRIISITKIERALIIYLKL